MSDYKIINGPKGTVRYMLNGRMVKATSIPEDVMIRLHETPLEKASDRLCIFCGAPSKYSRLVNLQSVYICNEHYYSKTLGQVAEQDRKQRINDNI